MIISTPESARKAPIEYLPGTFVAALDESWSGDDGSVSDPRWRRRPSKATQAAMREAQDAAAAAERWARPFRSAESPVLYTLMCQLSQCGARKSGRSPGLRSGNGKGYITEDTYKVLGLDHKYVIWLTGAAWYGLHLDFDRPVTLAELDGRVNVVVFAKGTYDVATQTYTAGCHTLSVLGMDEDGRNHAIPLHLATNAQRQGIKRLTKAAIQQMDADPAGSTGRIKNPLCEDWDIHILRETPFASLAEIASALGLNDEDRPRPKPSTEPAAVSRGIGPVVAELAGKLLRDRGGPTGWQGNVEVYVHSVLEASFERLGLTCDRAKVAKTGAAIARKMWRTYDPTKAGAPRRERNAGRLAGALEDVAPEDRKAAAGRLIGAERRDAARATIAKIKSAYVRLTIRNKGDEPGQDDIAAATGLSRRTLSTYWRQIRAAVAGSLNALERVNTLKSRQCAGRSLNKTEFSNGRSQTVPTIIRGISQSLTAWLASLADACPRGLYPVPVTLASHSPDLAPILPGATVTPMQAPRVSGRDAMAFRDADPMGWDACPF